MEETREQPSLEPAIALNVATENSVVSEDGSQTLDLGKFKSAKALLDAYNNLQAEFTKKSQQLSKLRQDKAGEEQKEILKEVGDDLMKNNENSLKNDENSLNSQENNQDIETNNEDSSLSIDDDLSLFLEKNSLAESYGDEIKSHYLDKNQNPFERAWASVIFSHIKSEDDKSKDPLINQYILNDEKVKNKIIEDYLTQLNSSRPPVMMSSQSGERLSDVKPDSPKTLAEAKELVGKMFS